jgi:MCP family monocarboxylic acid transporter-like MFS transporter 10
MTSLYTAYWQTMLAQGITIGLGIGCLFTLTTTLIAHYFSKRQGLAIRIISTSSIIGSKTYNLVGIDTNDDLKVG